MRRHWLTFTLILLIILAILLTLAQIVLSAPPAEALDPGPDAYEPDDPDAGEPAWIGEGEAQDRNFFPDGDVDRARFYVKAGHWYKIQTVELGSLVDTALRVEVAGAIYQDDDGGQEPMSSLVVFYAFETTEAIIAITNAQKVYGEQQTYRLHASETAPTPTPTATPRPTSTPTATPKPTNPPPATATPANPIVNFSISPDTLERPGDCATLRWTVDRASEVFLVMPNGTQEGVPGSGERQVCPTKTSDYQLKVNAPAGNQVVKVTLNVPLPTPTPTVTSTTAPDAGSTGNDAAPDPAARDTLHVTVFVDNNTNDIHDAGEGVEGAIVHIVSQANPNDTWTGQTDAQGQVDFAQAPGGSYSILIPHLNHAQVITFRGEETTISIAFPALRLPARIP